MHLILTALAMVVSATAAHAQQPPNIDITRFCRANADAFGGEAPCQKSETGRQGSIIGSWMTYPEQRRHFCNETVRFTPPERRSYQLLLRCLSSNYTS
jgi:hypothetical protein